MKYLLIILLFTSCLNTQDGTETAANIKQGANTITQTATDNKERSKAIVELSDKPQVISHAKAISKNSDTQLLVAKSLNTDANEVIGLNNELKKANSQADRFFNIAITGLIVFFIIASVASWVVFNSIKGVIGGILGAVICLSITWFFHHIGVVLAGVSVLIIGYLIYKKRNDTHKELIENIQFAKVLLPDEHKETFKAHLNNNQSCNTKLTVSKNK